MHVCKCVQVWDGNERKKVVVNKNNNTYTCAYVHSFHFPVDNVMRKCVFGEKKKKSRRFVLA